jgi:hypothetical protein
MRVQPISAVLLSCSLPLTACTADIGAGTPVQPYYATSNGTALNGTSLNGRLLNGTYLNTGHLNTGHLNTLQLNRSEIGGFSDVDNSWTGGTALRGATFTGYTDTSSYLLYINDVVAMSDPSPQSVNEGQLFAYDVLFLNQYYWQPLCGTDPATGRDILAYAINGQWDAQGNKSTPPGVATFGCFGSAVAKCVNLGYKPWMTNLNCNNYVWGQQCDSLADFHEACTRLIRADYCGNGTPHTRDGTAIDVADGLQIQIYDGNYQSDWEPEAVFGPDGAHCVQNPRLVSLNWDGTCPGTSRPVMPSCDASFDYAMYQAETSAPGQRTILQVWTKLTSSCTPTTSCAAMGWSCGQLLWNGCGPETCGSYNGGCQAGYECSGDSHQCVCVPTTTCAAQGKSCGTIWNGCATETCGSLGGACPGGATCSSGTCQSSGSACQDVEQVGAGNIYALYAAEYGSMCGTYAQYYGPGDVGGYCALARSYAAAAGLPALGTGTCSGGAYAQALAGQYQYYCRYYEYVGYGWDYGQYCTLANQTALSGGCYGC